MTNPWIKKDIPLIIAHRGHSIDIPENTMASYIAAVSLGAEMIETDVNITKDKQLVIVHDRKLGRTCNVKEGFVRDYTLEELQTFDFGIQTNGKHPNTRILTVSEALRFARDSNIYMCFEVKGDSVQESNEVGTRLANLFAEHDAFEWAFMSSYWHEAMRLAKNAYPQLLLAPERIPDDVEPDLQEALRQVDHLQANVLQLHYKYLYPDFIKGLHDREIALWAWPTTKEDEICAAITAKADALMGDDVALAVKLVNKFCHQQG